MSWHTEITFPEGTAWVSTNSKAELDALLERIARAQDEVTWKVTRHLPAKDRPDRAKRTVIGRGLLIEDASDLVIKDRRENPGSSYHYEADGKIGIKETKTA